MIVEMTMKRVAGRRQLRAVRRAGDIAVEGLHHSEDEPGHGIRASAWVVCERQGPLDILPGGAKRNWDQAKHGGGGLQAMLTAEAPSTALRAVPLPPFAGEESASYLASQLRNFLPGGVDEFGVGVGVAPDAPAAFGRFGQEHPGALGKARLV